MTNERIYYINIPYGAMLRDILKIQLYLFALYLLSFHPFIFIAILPAYLFVLHHITKVWNVFKQFNFKPLPFLTVLVLSNTPFLLLARTVQNAVFNLFK